MAIEELQMSVSSNRKPNGPRALAPDEVRRAGLRQDAHRPKGDLLEEAMRLSRTMVELAAAGRRAKP